MRRFVAQALLVLAPIAVYAWWIAVPVQKQLERGDLFHVVLFLLGGLAVLALSEGIIFKKCVLPALARFVSERLYAGSYSTEDDPFACLARKIALENRPDLLPQLAALAEADPLRVRAWLELARLLDELAHDPSQAVECLLQGADAVRRKEDAALLIWRAVTLLEKQPDHASRAGALRERLISLYPGTAYGKLAARRGIDA